MCKRKLNVFNWSESNKKIEGKHLKYIYNQVLEVYLIGNAYILSIKHFFTQQRGRKCI